MTQVQLAVEGMSCGHCVAAVREALTALDGVEVESVGIGSAVVRVDQSRVRVSDLLDAIADAGYSADEAPAA